MNDRFGEELSLDEILTDEEKAHDEFVSSVPGANFGPELTLQECIDILYESSLPPRARFWEDHNKLVQEAIHNFSTRLEIGEYQFKIEYVARIESIKKFDTSTPRGYFKFHPGMNGKGENDPESSDGDSSTTGSDGDSDV